MPTSESLLISLTKAPVMPIFLTSLSDTSNYFEFLKLRMKGNFPQIMASTFNVSYWKVVPGSLSFSILSWNFSFFPMIGCILSQEEQNQCSGQSQATECWANTHEWVHLWLLLIPWGSPNNPASPSFQCFFVLLLWSSTEAPEDLSCCSGGKNDCKSLGVTTQEIKRSSTFQFLQGCWGYSRLGAHRKARTSPEGYRRP